MNKITRGLMSSNTSEWSTPQDLFNELDTQYTFTLDPCATEENAKCRKYHTKKDNGLSKLWDGESVFMNPPYGLEIGKWIKKATEITRGRVVCLLPARTDTKWFHNYLYKKHNVSIEFLKGRIKFSGSKNSAPFPSMICVIDNLFLNFRV